MDQLRPWAEKNKKEILFFTIVILVLVIGVIVPGRAGDWIETVGGAALAIGILVTVGVSQRPRPERKRRWPY
jgi:1,4-dihydroxy-2-naphthoate octaprenyltransferase